MCSRKIVACRKTQKDPEFLDVRKYNSLLYSHFNKSHPTKIIIHGFGGGRNLAPSTDLRHGKLFCHLKIFLKLLGAVQVQRKDFEVEGESLHRCLLPHIRNTKICWEVF